MEDKQIHGYVYLLTNKVNGKRYVGQTTETIEIRFNKHCGSKKQVISKAIKKYGIDNFTVQELAVAYNQKQLNFVEGFFIHSFNTLISNGFGYNVKDIIDGKGKLSEETKEKMRKSANTLKRVEISLENGKNNRGKSRRNSSSKYCGVYRYLNKWRAVFVKNNKRIHLGTYLLEEDAAKAKDIIEIKHNPDCILNFPELREKYLNNEINITKETGKRTKISKNKKSNSNIIGVTFCNTRKLWRFEKYRKSRRFKSKEECETFALNFITW